jgi:hypothetical protein
VTDFLVILNLTLLTPYTWWEEVIQFLKCCLKMTYMMDSKGKVNLSL